MCTLFPLKRKLNRLAQTSVNQTTHYARYIWSGRHVKTIQLAVFLALTYSFVMFRICSRNVSNPTGSWKYLPADCSTTTGRHAACNSANSTSCPKTPTFLTHFCQVLCLRHPGRREEPHFWAAIVSLLHILTRCQREAEKISPRWRRFNIS